VLWSLASAVFVYLPRGCLASELARGNSHNATSYTEFFVFTDVSLDRVQKARRLGRELRREFLNSLESGELRNEEQEREFYATQFAKCSSIEGGRWEENSGQEHFSTKSASDIAKLVRVLNLDAVSTRFLLITPERQMSAIRHACTESELKFQCAHGFVNSVEKMRQHIRQMKETDGSFKVMAERECPLVEREDGATVRRESVYSCFTEHASEVTRACRRTIHAYNSTRRHVNQEIQGRFEAAVSDIDARLLNGGQQEPIGEELEAILKESESLMHQTLLGILPLEALKCSSWGRMEACIFNSVSELCPDDSGSIVNALTTLFRQGYFARERDEFLHQHFLESGIGSHSTCRQLSNE